MAFLLSNKLKPKASGADTKDKGKRSGKKSVKMDPEVLELIGKLDQKWAEQDNTLGDFNEII